MRRALTIVAILAAASFAAQGLDRDPLPTGVVSLVWGLAAIGVLVAFVGLAGLRRAASGHKAVAALVVMASVGAIAAVSVTRDVRLTTYRQEPETPAIARWLAKNQVQLPLPPAATAMALVRALRGVSHTEDPTGCSAFLRPDETLGPRSRVKLVDAINTSRNDLTAEVSHLRAALLDMERVPAFRQAARVSPANPAQGRIAGLYDILLSRGSLIAREQRRATRTGDKPPRLCVYGFAAVTKTPFIDDLEQAAAALPPDAP